MPAVARPPAVFLTPVLPARTGVGLAMRAGSQLAGLSRVFDVTVLLLPCAGPPHPTDAFHRAFPGVRLEVLDIRGQQDPFFRLIATRPDANERNALFARYGKPSLTAAISRDAAIGVADVVRQTQARWIHVFRSYLLGAIDEVPESIPRSIDLDEDDVSSFRSTAAVMEARGQVAAARWMALEADGFERLTAQKLRNLRIATLASSLDVTVMAARHAAIPFRAMPNCVALPPLTAASCGPEREGMMFVGTLGYWPNTDGLEWFMRFVLPRLPGARLRIAGANPPLALRAAAPRGRVEFLGYVEDLAPLYRRSALAIAPMRCGGGTRLKILEAGAFGVPVVATPEAATGLWKSHRPWGMTARRASDFAAACRSLLDAPGLSRRLGRAGRTIVAQTYSSARVDAAWGSMFRRLYEGGDA